MTEKRRIKVDEAELDRLAPLCGMREVTRIELMLMNDGVIGGADFDYDKVTGELVVLNDSSDAAQCLIRTIECTDEEVELEEGIVVEKVEGVSM